MRNCSLLWSGALGLCFLAGCAAPQPDAALTGARQEVAAAANNADVVSFATPELQRAQAALGEAEAALKKDDLASVDHYAFLATRHAQTAEQIAQEKRSEQAVANAPLARSQAMAAQAQAEAQRAREEAAEARSKQGLVITPRDILFRPGSAELDPNANATLRQVATYLKANPGRRVLIEGFTDSTGSAALNQQLSQQRADAVRLALANQGVDPSRIEIRGMGPAEPIASNASTAGRLLNRRVSIVISNADGTFPQIGTGSSVPLAPVAR
jgi:outer membrane protein OmpA-like peptidoglycan-associated protein